jgi:hypothetical protein
MQVPFQTIDFSHIKLNAAKRARQYAQPSWGENGRSHEEFDALMTEERRLNTEIEFGFEYNWLGSGYWGTDVAQPINFDFTPKIVRKLI